MAPPVSPCGGLPLRILAIVLALSATLAGCVAPAVSPAPPAGAPSDADGGAQGPVVGAAGFVNADPSGETSSGGAAVAHGYGGAPRELQGDAPDARLFWTGASALEPTLGIAPDGALYTTMMQRRTVGAVFYTPPTVLRSADGGATWGVVFQGHPTTQDPYTHVDPVTGRVFTADFVGCTLVSYSDDGESWTTAPPAGCGWNLDHLTLFTGPPVTSAPSGYPRLVYLCAIGAGAVASAGSAATCSKSADGGLTFTPTGEPAFTHLPALARSQTRGALPGCYAGTGHGFADEAGTLYLPRGHCDQPWLAVSRDEGATWARVQVSDLGMPASPTLTDHEAAVVADASGNVYYFWVAADWRPYLAISRDGGLTWGEPRDVSPPGLVAAALPALAMGRDGALAFAYMGTTMAPGRDQQWNGYLSLTTDARVEDPLFLTATVNSPETPLVVGECGPLRCRAQYDFLDVQVGPDGRAFVVLADAAGRGIVGTLAGAPSLR